MYPRIVSSRFWQNLGTLKTWVASFCWLTQNYWKFRAAVNGCGYEVFRLIPIKLASWHRGAKYFKGILNDGGRVFVKTDGVHRQAIRELRASQAIAKVSGSDIVGAPRIKFHDLSSPYPFIAFEWIEGATLEALDIRNISSAEVGTLCRSLLRLTELLSSVDIVHRDMTPRNLIVSRGKSNQIDGLVLIDFAFAVINGESEDGNLPVTELQVLGAGYKPEELLWDDAYSCLKIIESWESVDGLQMSQVKRNINERIGKKSYRYPVVLANSSSSNAVLT